MAIKINVSPESQASIKEMIKKAGYAYEKRKYHCTIGFIEKMLPEEEVDAFGQKFIQELQEFINADPLLYKVEKVAHLFDRVIAFLPTTESLNSLRNINSWACEKVIEISNGRWGLNKETLPQNFTPHLTLWHTHRPDHRIKCLEEMALTHPLYPLSEAAYVVFNKYDT